MVGRNDDLGDAFEDKGTHGLSTQLVLPSSARRWRVASHHPWAMAVIATQVAITARRHASSFSHCLLFSLVLARRRSYLGIARALRDAHGGLRTDGRSATLHQDWPDCDFYCDCCVGHCTAVGGARNLGQKSETKNRSEDEKWKRSEKSETPKQRTVSIQPWRPCKLPALHPVLVLFWTSQKCGSSIRGGITENHL